MLPPRDRSPAEIDISVDRSGDGAVVTVTGEVDVYTSTALRETLDDLIASGCSRIVLDLSELEFIDSTGLGVLVGALKAARGVDGDLVLRTPSKPTEKLLSLTALTELFTVEGPTAT